MKHSLIYPAICIFGLIFSIACKNEKPDHKELLEWLDSKDHFLYTSKSKEKLMSDNDIKNILEAASRINQYTLDSFPEERNGKGAIKIMENALNINEYLNNLNRIDLPTEPIEIGLANDYHNNYLSARDTVQIFKKFPQAILNDKSEATLFTLPQIIKSLKRSHNPNMFTWGDSTWWQGKGIFVFLANYGAKGRDGKGQDAWYTTSILQPASLNDDPSTATLEEWSVFEKETFNFGDLKPPKIAISNPDKAPIRIVKPKE